jgi:hypothetical protein
MIDLIHYLTTLNLTPEQGVKILSLVNKVRNDILQETTVSKPTPGTESITGVPV